MGALQICTTLAVQYLCRHYTDAYGKKNWVADRNRYTWIFGPKQVHNHHTHYPIVSKLLGRNNRGISTPQTSQIHLFQTFLPQMYLTQAFHCFCRNLYLFGVISNKTRWQDLRHCNATMVTRFRPLSTAGAPRKVAPATTHLFSSIPISDPELRLLEQKIARCMCSTVSPRQSRRK